MSGFRLSTGGSVDRSRILNFVFNGRRYQGHSGDTLASALLAQGQVLVARSFKYHRPRGIFGSGPEEPSALVQLVESGIATPNVKMTEIEVHEGLEARSVGCWPSPRFDVAALNQLFYPLLGAGFYYKTFMWPNWRLFEGAIRRAAGLGTVARAADPDQYEHSHESYNVLVIGAGPAGLSAALAAGGGNRSVLLIEARPQIDGGDPWTCGALALLNAMPNVQIATRTSAQGYYDHNLVVAVERIADPHGTRSGRLAQRVRRIRAEHIVLATGCIERPIVFAGNDRPGVMLASAVAAYLFRYGIACGRTIVIFTNNNDGYPVALALRKEGLPVTIVDARPRPKGALHAEAVSAGITVHGNSVVMRTHGKGRLRGVTVSVRSTGALRRIECDLLAVAGGWTPSLELFLQAGGLITFDESRSMHVPVIADCPVVPVGSARGVLGAREAVLDGSRAVRDLIGSIDAHPALDKHLAASREPFDIAPLTKSIGDSGIAFVDLANDVTASDIKLAAQENYASVEHLKRYTTLGMGPEQGKTSNINGLILLGSETNRTPGEVGTTRFRPPVSPMTMGAIAGKQRDMLLRPIRYLRDHEWHVAHNAVFDEYGSWIRPAAYPRATEDVYAASMRETLAVRNTVGIFDSSPLGKIEIKGPDAARLLDFLYVGTPSTLKPGRARYDLMLSEHGIVIDDGVIVRLGIDHYLVHTTSGNADRVAEIIEEWLQCELVDFDAVIMPVTTRWSTVTLSGPSARKLLAAVVTDIDLDPEMFPHMSVREGKVAGIEARVVRASFTGEVSYEINVKANSSAVLLSRIWTAGGAFGLTPYGVEALMILRTEKGYLHIGADTDGTTVPRDVGQGQRLERKSSDFVGRRSLSRQEAARTDRLELVGLNSPELIPIGTHVLAVGDGGAAKGSDGFVTSSTHSPSLGRPIALGLVRSGRSRIGESVRLYDLGREFTAEICEPVFIDMAGDRLRA